VNTLAIDIGGTKLAMALFQDGRIIRRLAMLGVYRVL